MDLNARVHVNCGRKDGRTDGRTDRRTDGRTPISHFAKIDATNTCLRRNLICFYLTSLGKFQASKSNGNSSKYSFHKKLGLRLATNYS